MEREYIYDAFISYRHMEFDKAVADRLQKLLEKYVPPTSIVPRVKRKKLRLFRDETELASSSNLSDEIKKALEASRFLIVICSKTTKESKWCCEEIEHFKELHGGSASNILTLLIEGEPSEVFPEELCFETQTCEEEDGSVTTETREVEPLATNIVAPTRKESLKKLNQEYLRLVAPLLGCRYDDLFNRNQRRRNRRNMLIASSLIIFLALFGIYSSIMMFQINTQRAEAQRNYEEAEIQRLLALTNLEEAEIQRLLAQNNLEEVKMLLLSNAIDYAERLNEQGARSRAGAVLRKVYENIDDDHENAEFLYARFRDVAVDTLYYNDRNLPFASHNLSGEILQISVATEYGFFIAITERVLYQLDLNNGDILEKYPAPDDTSYLVVINHGRYIFAVTDGNHIIAIDSETNEQVYSKDILDWTEMNSINIRFNEEISALILFADELIVDEEREDEDSNELFARLTFKVIPFDLPQLQFGEDSQALAFYHTPRFGWMSAMGFSYMGDVEGNGRFVALNHQYQVFETVEDGERAGFYAEATNNYIQVLDFNKFDSSLTPEENKQRMERFVDFRKSDEELFIIGFHTISPQGILRVEGWSWEEEGEIRLIPRIMVYNSQTGELIFNEQLDREYIQPVNNQGRILTWNVGDSVTPLGERLLLNQQNSFNYEILFHLIEIEEGFLALGKNSAEYSFLLEKVAERDDVGDLEEIFYMKKSSDHRLLVLNRREEGVFLQMYCLRSDRMHYWEYRIPDDFHIARILFYEDVLEYGIHQAHIHEIISGERFMAGTETLVLVGETGGNNRIITLQAGGGRGQILEELKTLDVIATAGAVDMESGKLIMGHIDGALLMYNFGRTHRPVREEVTVRRVRDGAVLEGHISTGTMLEQMNDENNIFPISYNESRTMVLGIEAEARFDRGRIHNIWCLETGEIIQTFDLGFAIRERADGTVNRLDLRMNSDFTHAILSTFDDRRYFYILDADTGDVMYEYNVEMEPGTDFNDVFFGISDEPHVIWLFHVDTLLLEIVDVAEGRVVIQKNVSERIRGHGGGVADLLGRTVGYYDGVYYNVGSDLIVFRGSADQIYSFTSRRSIFLGDCFACGRGDAIIEINSDGSAVYLAGAYQRIELEAEALFNALRQSPLIGTMTEEDIRATGLDIFD